MNPLRQPHQIPLLRPPLPRRPLSGDSDSGHLPGFSTVATSDVGGLLGEQSAKFYQRYVRQFQRGLLRDQRAVDLYIDFDCVSFIVFNR